jgi:hypothetical protein
MGMYNDWYDNEEYEYDDYEDDAWYEDADEFEWGCLYPDRCCMPSDHTTDECYTAEDYERRMREELEQERLQG